MDGLKVIEVPLFPRQPSVYMSVSPVTCAVDMALTLWEDHVMRVCKQNMWAYKCDQVC